MRRKLPARSDGGDVVSTVAFEFQAVLTGRLEDLETVHGSFSKWVESLYALCDSSGVSVVHAGGGTRPLSRDEILAIIPRKYHLDRGGRQACTTPHVSARYLTKDREKITCKLCLREPDPVKP